MESIKKLKKFYEDQSMHGCLKICRKTEANQIILIRHAEPKVFRKSYVTFEDAENHLNDYRNSGVDTNIISPLCIENLADLVVYHSDLNRSRETARQLFPSEDFTLIEDKRFRELDRQNIRLPFRIPYKLHTTLSRIAWLSGTMKNIELPKEAWKRLKENASYLDTLAQQQKTIIIVAHGFHNFFVGQFLKRLGYALVNNGGIKHLSINIWARSR